MSVPAQEKESKPPASVPPNIFFDHDLLLIPSTNEVGIPDELAVLGRFEPQVKVEEWVNRGEPLLSAHFSFYHLERSRWWSWIWDPIWSHSDTLASPVSGLVIDFRRQATSIGSPYGVTYYDQQAIVPVLLVPRDEPPADRTPLHSFYGAIGAVLRDHSRQLPLFRRNGGWIRLHEAGEELKTRAWEDAQRVIADFRDPARDTCEVRQMTVQDKVILSHVQHLRAYDLALRDKLVHLTRLEQDPGLA